MERQVRSGIGAVRAWDLTTGSTNVIVAVIDTGIRHTHDDLAAQMWRHPGEIANNGRDDDGDGYVDNQFGINAIVRSGNPPDDNGHGTHVAGTIGAAANDGNRHVGVAWNVRLLACKFLDGVGGGTTGDAIQCIQFSVAHGARILNNSWGGGPFSRAIYDAIASARDKGVLFVAAAGNDGATTIGRLPIRRRMPWIMSSQSRPWTALTSLHHSPIMVGEPFNSRRPGSRSSRPGAMRTVTTRPFPERAWRPPMSVARRR